VTALTRILALTALAVGTVTAAGCGSSQSSSAPSTPAATTSAKAASPAAQRTKPQASKVRSARAAVVPDTIHCVDVPHAVTERILRGVLLDGAKLGHVEAVAAPKSPGYYFITSTVSGGGASPHSVATWAANGLAGASNVYSVDAFAALISTYGDATELDSDLNIHERAAYQSRVCAGGPGVSRGAPAPRSGIGNAPANG
jgi:hypothetical protein